MSNNKRIRLDEDITQSLESKLFTFFFIFSEILIHLRTDCKCRPKYEQLSAIDIHLFPTIKWIFIFAKFDASDVIFITNSDDVYGFGTNEYGRLGFGNETPVSEPTIIPELCGKGVKDIIFGQKFMIALTESLSLYHLW